MENETPGQGKLGLLEALKAGRPRDTQENGKGGRRAAKNGFRTDRSQEATEEVEFPDHPDRTVRAFHVQENRICLC